MSLALFFLFLLNGTSLFSQVDTTALKLEVDSIETFEDKRNYWIKIRQRDQSFRGPKYSVINDLENLISVSYYLNKFGYPIRDIDCEESEIISMVWIHNNQPKVKRISFPILLHGFQAKEIKEGDLRSYYLRNLYSRKFNDQLYLDKSLSEIFKELELNIVPKIDINQILEAYNDSQNFLEENHEIIGQWQIKNSSWEEVKIFKTNTGDYYLHNIYQDGSHYPQLLYQDQNYENLFRVHLDSEYYYAIQESGKLTIRDREGVRHYAPQTRIKYIRQ